MNVRHLSFSVFLLLVSCASTESSSDTPTPADVPDVATAGEDVSVEPDTAGALLEVEFAAVAASAPAGEVLTLALTVTRAGAPAAGESVTVTVLAGGGSLESSPAPTSEARMSSPDGTITVDWRLGVVPVPQRLRAATSDGSSEVAILATRATPLSSAPFADVAAFLTAEKHEESTEDLVVVGDEIIMGAPAGLLTITAEAKVARRALTGAPIGRGWGVAAEADGTVWVVDAKGQTLNVVSPEGEASVVLAGHDEIPFDGLNDVEVGPDGRVYATDPCTARLIVWDPAEQAVITSVSFDPAIEGGPNGMTFDKEGRLYVSTENTVILCGQTEIADFDAPLTRIVRFDLTADGVGERHVVGKGLGVFGDGMTFDGEGNLYAIIDTLDGLALGESAVWVFPGAEGPPQKLLVAEGVLYANLAFGRGALGENTLYLGLLNVPPFTDKTSRGLQRVDVGLARAPWL